MVSVPKTQAATTPSRTLGSRPRQMEQPTCTYTTPRPVGPSLSLAFHSHSRSMLRPRFMRIPARRNRGSTFMIGRPLSQMSSVSTAVMTPEAASVFPAVLLNVVRPGETEPMTPPTAPTPRLAIPVHMTSWSVLNTVPVALSTPATRRHSERMSTSPRPPKVPARGRSADQTTLRGSWSVQTLQKACTEAGGKRKPSCSRSSFEMPKAMT
mmetsp:Transcript_93251/g.263636  ORF Transcript_93251/g.263636 Transcript_93251/m.263636 type:complete len:210 (+) Transcript_93251:1209-1838(+)